MAIYGTLGEIDLGALSASISDTAVDIFIYDTSKDSDGGAWRKRTQHTSWYNETLNTATRGSRREFPAVAVIVAEATQVTIYDGDDPDLPMWMVFDDANQFSALGWINDTCRAISMLNGILCVCRGGDAGVVHTMSAIKFIEDCVLFYQKLSGTNKRNGNISQRNSPSIQGMAGGVNINTEILVTKPANDVAMTVLPNAPIDPSTGLPIPTIAVATNFGGSVIRDDGTVVDFGSGNSANAKNFQRISIDPNRGIFVTNIASVAIHIDIPIVDYSNFTSVPGYYELRENPGEYPSLNRSDTNDTVEIGNNGDAFGNDNGITLFNENFESKNDSQVAYVSTSYNTGWMHGDIKGAFLSDTDATNAVGTELHPNGNSDFSSTDVSYIVNTSSGTATVTNNQLVLSGGTAGYSDHIISVNTEVGAKYVISIDYVTNNGSNGNIGMYVNNTYLIEANDGNGYAVRSTGNSYTWYFTADDTTEYIDLVTAGSTSNTYTFDNWTIKKVEEDRSVNGKGLQVFGTITKSAVA